MSEKPLNRLVGLTDPDDECDVDSVFEDCGESTVLDAEEARNDVRHYNQVLEARFGFRRDVPSRCDPRSILHGL